MNEAKEFIYVSVASYGTTTVFTEEPQFWYTVLQQGLHVINKCPRCSSFLVAPWRIYLGLGLGSFVFSDKM